MKKFTLAFAGLLSLAFLLFTNCSKSLNQDGFDQETVGTQFDGKTLQPPAGKDTVQYYTRLFLKDTNFARYMEAVCLSATDVAKTVKTKCGVGMKSTYQQLVSTANNYTKVDSFYLAHNIDTAYMANKKADIIARSALLYDDYRDFFRFSLSIRQSVINNVIDSLNNQRYISQNANDLAVGVMSTILVRFAPSISTGRLTQEETLDCLKGAVGGVFVGIYSLVTEVYSAIANTAFSFSMVKSVAKKALRSFAGGALIGSAIQFGICLAWDAWD